MSDLSLPRHTADRMLDIQNRYIIPSFVERTSYGIKESNPYNKMFEERIIFLGVQIDDASANDVMAQPNSRIIIHQPATEGGYGQSSDIEIQAKEILRMRAQLEEMISRHSGQSIEKVRKDIDRDKILTAEEAKEYGLVDQVLASRKKGALAVAAAS